MYDRKAEERNRRRPKHRQTFPQLHGGDWRGKALRAEIEEEDLVDHKARAVALVVAQGRVLAPQGCVVAAQKCVVAALLLNQIVPVPQNISYEKSGAHSGPYSHLRD